MKKLNSTQTVFFIPFLIFIYHSILYISFGAVINFGVLGLWMYSYVPILTVFIFYKYFLKKYCNNTYKKYLLSISLFLLPFGCLLAYLFPDLEKIKDLNFAELSIADDIRDFKTVQNLFNLKGIFFILLFPLGGALMPLEDFFELKSIPSSNKKIFIRSFFITIFMSIGLFVFFSVYIKSKYDLREILPNEEVNKPLVAIREFLKGLGFVLFQFYSLIFLLSSLFQWIWLFFKKNRINSSK